MSDENYTATHNGHTFNWHMNLKIIFSRKIISEGGKLERNKTGEQKKT